MTEEAIEQSMMIESSLSEGTRGGKPSEVEALSALTPLTGARDSAVQPKNLKTSHSSRKSQNIASWFQEKEIQAKSMEIAWLC